MEKEFLEFIGNQNGPVTWILLVLFIYEFKKILTASRDLNIKSQEECSRNNEQTRELLEKTFSDHKDFVVKLLDKLQVDHKTDP